MKGNWQKALSNCTFKVWLRVQFVNTVTFKVSIYRIKNQEIGEARQQRQFSYIFLLCRKNNVKSTGDIKGFGVLRYEDQAKIKEKIASGGVVKTGKGNFM